MPGRATCTFVDKLYTKQGSSNPSCPFTGYEVTHGSSDSSFQYCHWLPKHLQNKLPTGLTLDDNAANFFPTISLVEQNTELYQRAPNMSLRFITALSDKYDEYILELNPNITLSHPLRTATGATGDREVVVAIPKMSRPFVTMHHRVFCAHLSNTPKPGVSCHLIANSQPVFEKLQAETLFCLIMMNSPFATRAKKGIAQQKCESTFQAPKLDPRCERSSQYPEMQLPKEQAKRLVGQTIRISSEMFPHWDIEKHLVNAFVSGHDSSTRAFELVFPDEYDSHEFDRFKKEYTGNAAAFNLNIYKGQSEASIIKFGESNFVRSLEKTFRRESKVKKSSSVPRAKTHRSSATLTQVPAQVVLPLAVCGGARVRVYSANQWFEGTIVRADGLSATVLYDDDGADGQSEEHADFGKFKYTLVAKPAGGQEPGEAIAGHTCNRCHILHQHVDAPSDRVCCSQCKSSFHEVGSGQRKVRRNTVGP